MRWIVIHHTGAEADSTPEGIDAYHKGLGWEGIGYHFVVRQDGTAYYCGDVNTQRANVYGRNHEVVGIVLTGMFSLLAPLPEQLTGAKRAIAYAKRLLGDLPVVGHRDIALPESPTACPGNTWVDWREELI